jgi:hypothetical protein
MPKKYGDYKGSVTIGEAAEELFMNALKKEYPNCTVNSSNFYDNYTRHIDVHFRLNKCKVSFDVKSEKKVNRKDSDTSKEYTWIELQNNHGGPGWAYGSEKYIAFEWGDEFIIVERNALLSMVNEKKVPGILTENNNLPEYSQYQRAKWGNKDICVLTPISDIKDISHKIIKKA